MDASVSEPIVIDVKGGKRIKGKIKRKELLKGLPVREFPCTLADGDTFCDRCGTALKEIGYTKYILVRVRILRYTQQECECLKCKHTANPFIKKAFVPCFVMNHSPASLSSVSYVVSPYRQKKGCGQHGISLSRATMVNWGIRCAEDHFRPVVKHFRIELMSRDVVHCDETLVQVLKGDGKKPQNKSYMWL